MFNYLLPNKFKRIGWALILICPVFLILMKDVYFTIDQLEDIASIFALIGLALTIASEEKDEDERTGLCRYKALAYAFFVFISFTICSKLFNLVDFWGYVMPHIETKGVRIFDTPMGLLYFAALYYHINFRGLLRDEK